MRIIIRIGGSVLASPPNPEIMRRYADIIRELRDKGHEVAVVVGGGSLARDLINFARETGLSEHEQDEVAISASRIFAQILAMKIGGFHWKDVPTTIDEAVKMLKDRGVIIMGGVKPGMTTDTVAALLASEAEADLIVKATDQDGIYTKDPRKHPDAEKIDEIRFENLSHVLIENRHRAGIHQIIDPEAVRILTEKRVKTMVVNGFKPENVLLAAKGEKIGTIVY
ncbi:MAG: UMP kinase [Candidatus Bathyarchaeia archaeon]|nr:UMP kinase [Candidatus Bathyarchaeota archaeon]